MLATLSKGNDQITSIIANKYFVSEHPIRIYEHQFVTVRVLFGTILTLHIVYNHMMGRSLRRRH